MTGLAIVVLGLATIAAFVVIGFYYMPRAIDRILHRWGFKATASPQWSDVGLAFALLLAAVVLAMLLE